MADDDLDMLQELLNLAEDAETGALGGSSSQASLPLPPQNTLLAANTLDSSATKRFSTGKTSPAFQPASSRRSSPAPAANAASAALHIAHKQQQKSSTGTIEKFSGLRMTNACFPSIVLKERLADIQFCKLSQVRNKSPSDDNWATIATVAEKSTRESAKGQAYSVWRLTDLQGTNISFFLFKNAQSGLWKESVGAVVAVFKPQMRCEDGKFSLSVDSEQQVVKLGTSVDLGFCGARKKDGTPCKNAVNMSTCPYCDYHVQSQYNKIRSNRNELKDNRLHQAFHYANGARLGASNVPKMTEGGERLLPKVPTVKKHSQQEMQRIAERASKCIPGAARYLGTVMPGQPGTNADRLQPASKVPAYGPMSKAPSKQSKRTMTRHEEVPNKRPKTDDQHTAGVAGVGVEPGVFMLQDDEVDWENQGQDTALQHALAVIKTKGGLTPPDPNRPFDSRSHLQRTAAQPKHASHQQHSRQSKPAPLQPCKASGARALQPQQQQQGQQTHKPASADAAASRDKPGHECVMQSQCQQEQSQPGSSMQDALLSRAPGNEPSTMQQQKSVLQTATNSFVSKAADAKVSAAGRQLTPAGPQDRVLAKLGLGRKPGQTLQASSHKSQAPTAAAPSGFAAAFGSVASDEHAERTETRYKDLVDNEEHDRQMRVLAALEKKDEMQQRIEAITKLNVTAFQCNTCKCTTERRKLECRQHDVQRVTATKRWWVCCHCNNRFHTLAVRLPMQRCPKCNDPGMEFKAASMGRAVKENAEPAYASRGSFKARGVEHAFGLSSMV